MGRLDMTPSFFEDYSGSMGLGYSVLFCDFRNRHSHSRAGLSDCFHFLSGKPDHAMLLSGKMPASSLFNTIIRIILNRAKKKMTRIATSRIVAFMKHPYPGGDFSNANRPCNPVGPPQRLSKPKNSITLPIAISRPLPTTIREFVHLFPKISDTPRVPSVFVHGESSHWQPKNFK